MHKETMMTLRKTTASRWAATALAVTCVAAAIGAPLAAQANDVDPSLPTPVIHMGEVCLAPDGVSVLPYDLSFTWDLVANPNFDLRYSFNEVAPGGAIGEQVNGGQGEVPADHYTVWPSAQGAPAEVVTWGLHAGTFVLRANLVDYSRAGATPGGPVGGVTGVFDGPTASKTFEVKDCSAPTGFGDVSGTPGAPSYSTFATEIAWMSAQGISTGYDIGGGKKEYRPFGTVTRDAMAAFLYRAAGSPTFTAPAVSPFTDVTPTSAFYKEIAWMASEGISTGYDIGGGKKEFRPFANITRDAMAAFLYRYAGEADTTVPPISPFTDVPTNNSFYGEITWLASTGITTGWDAPGGKKEFRPYNAITRDAMAAFLYRYAHLA